MRLLLITLSTLTAVILFGTSAEAQNYPWCAYYRTAGTAAAQIAGCDVRTMHGNRARARQFVPTEYAIRASTRAASVGADKALSILSA